MGRNTLIGFDAKAYYKEYAPKYFNKNKERLLEYQRNYRKNNPERTLLNKARGRAKELGRDFDISLEDIVIPERCPILNIPLFPSEGVAGKNSPVVDRIDNSKGYVKGNVAVISYRANALKSDLTKEDVQRLLDYLS